MRHPAPNPDPQAEVRRLQEIAELQKLIAQVIAGQINHQIFVASVANWVALVYELRAQR